MVGFFICENTSCFVIYFTDKDILSVGSDIIRDGAKLRDFSVEQKEKKVVFISNGISGELNMKN